MKSSVDSQLYNGRFHHCGHISANPQGTPATRHSGVCVYVCMCVCVRMDNSTYIAAAQTPRYDRSIVHVTIGLQLNMYT